MLAIERRNEILTNLQKKQSVLVSELSKQYGVTEETIRRDLEKLEMEGLVKKTYGGAVLKQSLSIDMPLKIRQKTNRTEKKYIGAKAAELIEDGDSIMMDSSSTVLYIAKAIKHKNRLTIITNSVEILLEYADAKNIKVISTGGRLREASLSLVGPNAVRTLREYNVDKAFFSCKGVDMEKGVTESNESEAEIKKTMLLSARQIFLAADSSKFGQVSFASLMALDRADYVITDQMEAEEYASYFKAHQVHVIH